MVVVRAAHIGVQGQFPLNRFRLGQGLAIEPLLEDGADAAVGRRVQGQGALTGGLQARLAVAPCQATSGLSGCLSSPSGTLLRPDTPDKPDQVKPACLAGTMVHRISCSQLIRPTED